MVSCSANYKLTGRFSRVTPILCITVYFAGVTVLLKQPDLSTTDTSFPGTEPMGNENSTAVRCKKQDEIEIGWDTPKGQNTDNLNGICKNIYATECATFPPNQKNY